MIDGFTRWWTGDDRANRSRPLWLAFWLACVCAACLLVGVPRSRIYGHDVFFMMDGAWRVLHGQRPGVDFYAMLGPLWYLLDAAGMAMAGNAARGIGYATAMTAAAVGVWSWLLLRREMAAAPRFLACMFLVLLAGAPVPLGLGYRVTAIAMQYNRYGFALACLVLLECLLPNRDVPDRRSRFFGGFSSGLACAALVFLKISYGLVGIGLVCATLAFRRREGARLAGWAAGFALLTAPLLVYLRFDVPALAREYAFLAQVRGRWLSLDAILNSLSNERFEIGLIAVLTLFVMALPGQSMRRRMLLPAGALLSLGASELLLQTNAQTHGLPLYTAFALVLIEEVTQALKRRTIPNGNAAALLGFGLLAVCLPLSTDALGLAQAVSDRLVHPAQGYRFQAPHLAGLVFYDGAESDPHDNGALLVDYTSEAFELVRAHSRTEESVVSLTMSNPFSFGLLRPPAHGGAAFLASTNVSAGLMPPLERLLGDAAILLDPKFQTSVERERQAILQHYPQLLGGEYVLVAESDHWRMYRRRAR